MPVFTETARINRLILQGLLLDTEPLIMGLAATPQNHYRRFTR